MKEKRQFPRTSVTIEVRVWHESFGEMVVKTRDVSQGGVFLVTGAAAMPPVGTVLEGQVLGREGDLPVVKMEIVRMEPSGVGLRFVLTE